MNAEQPTALDVNGVAETRAEPAAGAAACRHRFVEAARVLFVGSEGARYCEACRRIEVLVKTSWVSLDDYLDRRRALRGRSAASP